MPPAPWRSRTAGTGPAVLDVIAGSMMWMRMDLPALGKVSVDGLGMTCGSMPGAREAGQTTIIADEMPETACRDGAGRMVERLAAGNVRALARTISMVEDEAAEAAELLAACDAWGRRALRIGITGAPGAGKSTLIDQMVRLLRARGQTVAVLAVDPSSPLTGGALLGDRIRMHGFAGDAGIYLRSVASRGALGGVTRTAAAVCRVIEAAGFSNLILETVGVGQSDVVVADLVDVTLLVLVPGMGDDVQSLKAGVMEVADIFVVNKKRPGGDGQGGGGGCGDAVSGLRRNGAGGAGGDVRRRAVGDGVAEVLECDRGGVAEAADEDAAAEYVRGRRAWWRWRTELCRAWRGRVCRGAGVRST